MERHCITRETSAPGDATPSHEGTFRGNSVRSASDRGLAIGFGASPTLSENLSCDNGENLWVAKGADPAIDDSNEICEDAPAE
jgi:hypothetical protein